MSPSGRFMFSLTILAAIVWALRFVPQAGLPADLTDFAGGVSTGTLIGAAVVIWSGRRTPPDPH